MTPADKSRLMWLCGYVKGAIVGVWAMCSVQEREVVDAEAVAELEGRVDELCALVERMVEE